MSSIVDVTTEFVPDTTAAVRIDGVEHRYGPTQVLGPIDLSVQPGSFLVLVGASGCGTTGTISWNAP